MALSGRGYCWSESRRLCGVSCGRQSYFERLALSLQLVYAVIILAGRHVMKTYQTQGLLRALIGVTKAGLRTVDEAPAQHPREVYHDPDVTPLAMAGVRIIRASGLFVHIVVAACIVYAIVDFSLHGID
jgi:hypothetical protein